MPVTKVNTVKKGNSRFLFSKQIVENIDIADAMATIDEILYHSSRVKQIDEKIRLDFNLSPLDDSFKKSQVLIGREIIGYDSQIFEQLDFIDLSSQLLSEVPLQNLTDWDEVFKEAAKYLNDQNNWHLIINENFSNIWVQF
jgi:hypothetical protein